MTKFGIMGTAALALSVLASPAMAQDAGSFQRQAYRDHAYRGQFYQDQGYRQDRNWRDSYNRYDDNSGFWPADVAAGLVGGAVGTAAAIGAGPIGAEAYARRNGFVCLPGTWFRGEDGRMHICQ